MRDGGDRRRFITLGAAVALAGCGAPPAPTLSVTGRPRRIVSLNPCLDVILTALVAQDRIAALSHWSRQRDSSTIADTAATLPSTRGGAEDLVRLRPDLVLIPRFGGPVATPVLKRLGLRAELFDLPETVAASLAQVRQLAAAVGEPARGEALAARIEAAIARAAPADARRVSALVFMPGGFASGPGTLMDEMMRRAGLTNAAARYGLGASMGVPLERVVADPPDLLLVGQAAPGAASRAERLLDHPALTRVSDRMARSVFPQRLLYCGGPVLIQTAAVLARARRFALERRA